MKSDRGDGLEFCKIVCRNGRWRGPVCNVEVDKISGLNEKYFLQNKFVFPVVSQDCRVLFYYRKLPELTTQSQHRNDIIVIP